MNATMPLARLAQICAAYGGDPHRWPAAERAAAQALCAASAEARALVGEAAALDQTLQAGAATGVTPQLRARVLASIPQARRHGFFSAGQGGSSALAELFGWRPALPALALALACGIAAGLWFPEPPEAEDELTVAMATAFQEPEDY